MQGVLESPNRNLARRIISMTYTEITLQKPIVQVTKPVRLWLLRSYASHLPYYYGIFHSHLSGTFFVRKRSCSSSKKSWGFLPSPPSQEKREQAERNRHRFEALPESDRVLISRGYAHAQEQKALPFLAKLKASFMGLGTELSNFELAWIILSIVVPILVLKQMEGLVWPSGLCPSCLYSMC